MYNQLEKKIAACCHERLGFQVLGLRSLGFLQKPVRVAVLAEGTHPESTVRA